MNDTHDPVDARSVSELLASTRRAGFLCFWGHRPPAAGGVSASCLSQWWAAGFTVDGVAYRTAEHYMMAGKARLFGDAEAESRIIAAAHPRDAKVIGREVRGFDQEAWEAARFGIVVDGSVAKFGQNEDLGTYLLGTASRVLVEASPRDRVWGIGLGADHDHAEQPAHWRGLNLLGFALMEARSRLAAASA
ncbi:NADAR family protein [Nocardiopsis sp. CT-R113]|uniref:NADAR family protein n=1 Tax=Nocardiopsis codii TaxID=3065942 RepID=A0ABU7KH33_9ACTN|nr:NADAR family protein [Nocardiopsis sp. CT-R113]MEE2041522.1 NADAR family protein [Nocardiopsis sp. CT-R113]